MSGYKHILVAADLASDHERILPRAVELARGSGAKVTLLHVVDERDEGGEMRTPVAGLVTEPGSALPAATGAVPKESDVAHHKLERSAYAFLNDLTKGLGLPAVETEVIGSSSIWRAIVEVAKEKGADLIVVGSHRREGLDWIFGGTADRLVRRAPCDVLAVHDK
jgi:universal stress protein A